MREHSQILAGTSVQWVALLSRILAVSLKRCKIGPTLLLFIYRKWHTRFRQVPKSTTLDDLERPLCTLLPVNTCIFQSLSGKYYIYTVNGRNSPLMLLRIFRRIKVIATSRGFLATARRI